ncbi:MAG: hypothetical protein A2X18_06890 [Bacteroidetes bacterium GWF2_40_14]|nr:MAG: hypothetical protein A2X18_06890 [Bacteroidetes bacterium GWF2_40_14]
MINIDLNKAEKIIVAEGLIELGSNGWIRLSYSSDYFDGNKPEYIDNAIVTLSDNNGGSEQFKYKGNGMYLGNLLKGKPDKKYSLKITIGNKTYTAESTLFPPAPIISVNFEEQLFQQPGDLTKSYSVILKFMDNPFIENHYMIQIQLNDTLENNSYILLKDSYYIVNGTIEYKPLRHRFAQGDSLIIGLYSIDKETYKYYNQLNDLKVSGMGASSTPYNPLSNFGTHVMGYFAAYSSTFQAAVVK